jgi:hypothetical protein
MCWMRPKLLGESMFLVGVCINMVVTGKAHGPWTYPGIGALHSDSKRAMRTTWTWKTRIRSR